MRINIVMEFDQFNTEERAAFKLSKRCDVKDIANYLHSLKCMNRVKGNEYTTEQGTYSEPPIDVEATIVESILGLGAIYAAHGFPELEDMPELVVLIE
eukprot:11036596-Heterocapsa_arctica.AAC.1